MRRASAGRAGAQGGERFAARLAMAAVMLAVAPACAQADALRERVDAFRAAHEVAIVGQLDELVRIPSVAADRAGLHAMAERLEARLRERGFTTRLLSSADAAAPPVVYGERLRRGARRTVVFYAHYDGQPVTPSEWVDGPFEPAMRSGTLDAPGVATVDWRHAPQPFDPEWRLYGRAAGDDKASIVAFLAAFDALAAAKLEPAVNLKVFWEGEEESSSPHLESTLRDNAALLASDLWLIGDGPVHQSRKPMLYFGARGLLGLEATVYGPLRPLHDGHYGNWAPNPAALAAQLIAELRDPDGMIRIPGFGDAVRPLTPAEQSALEALPTVDAELRREFGIGRAEAAQSLAASTMRPALNVRGIAAGHVGTAAANAIPTEATVSIDFRLVPDQTPALVRDQLTAYLRARGWTVVESDPDLATRRTASRLIKLAWGGGYPAYRVDMSTPSAQAVIGAATNAAGEPIALLPMMGASVPIYLIAETLHAAVIGLPIANHDDNQHAANENLRLRNLWDGIAVYAAMMRELRW